MNFSQFLVQNPDVPKTNKPNEGAKIEKETEKERDTPSKDKKKEPAKKLKDKIFDIKSKTIDLKSKPIVEEECHYQPPKFKRGDFVIIQRLENSDLNVYKGYFGEIKQCRIIDDSAYVILEAMNYPIPIKFPIGHLVHRTKFF
jgi:hypothetical protein